MQKRDLQQSRGRWGLGLLVGLGLLLPLPLLAQQTFSSGSTGADGPFNPTVDTTLTLPSDGIFNFTTVNIPAGVTVTFQKNAANIPVTLLASGDVTIAGTIDVSGEAGQGFGRPGQGGPGGFDGGEGADGIISVAGTPGPGGGGAGGENQAGAGGSFAGLGTAGRFGSGPSGGRYGTPTLLPLIGGSGGGGGGRQSTGGAGGGGGGGAILIASSGSTILNGGRILANGGNGATSPLFEGGGGSGGAIRLIANTIAGSNATISAVGGTAAGPSGRGGAGRIRFEAFTFALAGPVTPSPFNGLPGLVFRTPVPTLRISAIGGVATPASPTGTFLSRPDLTLAGPATNPVTVTVTASNIPPGTSVQITVIPRAGARATFTTGPLTGTEASSTASAAVTIPDGTSVLLATAVFGVTQTASLGLPTMIGGEPVKAIRVAATYGGGSTVTYITASGREVPMR